MRSKAERARRRAAQAEALECIKTMTDEQLKNLASEIGREMGEQQRKTNLLRVRLEAVRIERERRRVVTSNGVHVSDHAVIRYLERHKGVDVQGAREEIAQMAARNGWRSDEEYGRAQDDETGIVVGFNGLKGIVTTVLDREERRIMGDVVTDQGESPSLSQEKEP